MRCHFLITFPNLLNDFIVSVINLLKECLLELLLEMNQSGAAIEPYSIAKLMALKALAFLTAAVEGRFLAFLVGTDVVDIEAALALELRLRDGLKD